MAFSQDSVKSFSTILKFVAVLFLLIFIISFLTQGAGQTTNTLNVGVYSDAGKVGVIQVKYPLALQHVETGAIEIKLLPGENVGQEKYWLELKFKDFDFTSIDPNPPSFKLSQSDTTTKIYYVKLKHAKASNVVQRLPFSLLQKSSSDLVIGEGNEITIKAVEKTDFLGISKEVREWFGAFGGGSAILSFLLSTFYGREKQNPNQ